MQDRYRYYQALPGTALAVRGVAALEPMTFLENLEIDADGAVVATSLLDGRLWSVPFGGSARLICQMQGRAYSVAAAPNGGWLVFGTAVGGRVVVFRVTASGEHCVLAELPDAVFPNGVLRFPDGHYRLADSVTATIWDFHFETRRVFPWYRHASLGPHPGEWAPALNGLKVFGDRLFMTNSSSAQVLALQLNDSWEPRGEPQVIADDMAADDFAFDTKGSMYLTTHPLDVLLKLTPEGVLTRVAGAEQGVRGCTACRFGRRPGDETGLYVITDGGLFNPASGGLRPAQIVRLETGVSGAPVDVE